MDSKYSKQINISAFGYFSYCYNNSIFGMCLAVCIPLLFSDLSVFQQKMYGSLCFMMGFLSRPIGGFLFGFLGDTKGRAIAMSVSSLFLVVPTVCIAFLPHSTSIGAVPLLLLIIFLRFAQGIGLGGNFSNTIVYIAEQGGIGDKFKVTGFVTSAGFFGAAIGTCMAFITAIFLPEDMAWRFSLFLGGVVGYVAYILINQIKEDIPVNYERPNLQVIREHFRDYRAILVMVFFLGGLNFFPIYLATVYMNYSFVSYFGYKTVDIMFNNTVMLAVTGVFVVMSVPLLKKLGPFRLLKGTMLFYLILAVPMYTLAFHFQSVFSLSALQIFLLIGDGPMILAVFYLVPRLFPAHVRCSSVGVSLILGSAWLGGCAPLLASYFAYLGGSEVSVSLLLLVMSVTFLIIVLLLERSSQCLDSFPEQVDGGVTTTG